MGRHPPEHWAGIRAPPTPTPQTSSSQCHLLPARAASSEWSSLRPAHSTCRMQSRQPSTRPPGLLPAAAPKTTWHLLVAPSPSVTREWCVCSHSYQTDTALSLTVCLPGWEVPQAHKNALPVQSVYLQKSEQKRSTSRRWNGKPAQVIASS